MGIFDYVTAAEHDGATEFEIESEDVIYIFCSPTRGVEHKVEQLGVTIIRTTPSR